MSERGRSRQSDSILTTIRAGTTARPTPSLNRYLTSTISKVAIRQPSRGCMTTRGMKRITVRKAVISAPVDNWDKPPSVRLPPPAGLYWRPGESLDPLRDPRSMRFSPQFLDELRARLPVSEVVGRRVKLKKSGREWRGLSPFNQEKTPSFFVNDPEDGVVRLLLRQERQHLRLRDDDRGAELPRGGRAAGDAGRDAPAQGLTGGRGPGPAPQVPSSTSSSWRPSSSRATLASRVGAKARGLSCRPRARSGHAGQVPPGLRTGPSALRSRSTSARRGCRPRTWSRPACWSSATTSRFPYDRFRDRVMFPITDVRGRVIAFGGRALEKDAPAKYLNSPETPLFHKGGTLYNIANARAAAHKGAPVIAVEGYVDVIAMVSAGYEASVAPLGTALTADQIALLWKMADEPTLWLRRRPGGARRRLSRCRLGAAAAQAGQEPEILQPARGQRPRRSRALGTAARRSRRSSARRARSRRCCGCGRPRPAASIPPSAAPRSRPASAR